MKVVRAVIAIVWSNLFIVAECTADPTPIFVSNGGPWGSWGPLIFCPPGSKAAGFSFKVESFAVSDLTAMNGIRLHCFNAALNETVIESTTER